MKISIGPRTASGLSAIAIAAGIAVWSASTGSRPAARPIAFRDFMRDVDTNKIAEVTITGQTVIGLYRGDNQPFQTFAPDEYADLASTLSAHAVIIRR